MIPKAAWLMQIMHLIEDNKLEDIFLAAIVGIPGQTFMSAKDASANDCPR
jgi:hypothetical protein